MTRTILPSLLLVLALAPRVAAQSAFPAPVEGDFVAKDVAFASGDRLAEVTIHYRTVGTPRKDADGVVRNGVLILHGTGGTGRGFLGDAYAGRLFGKGQPLDAEKFFIILPDNVGHGQSSKPSDGLRMKFPRYGYTDMVKLQHALVTQGLGLSHLTLVMGTSMGAMHTWVWGYLYPGFASGLVPLASNPVEVAGRNRVWRKLLIDAIVTDPTWKNGDYTEQPRGLASAIGFLLMATSVPLQWQKQFPTRAAADTWLADQIASRSKNTDANDMLYYYRAIEDYDPSSHLAQITAPLLAINSADDFVNPPELPMMQTLIKNVPRGRFILLPITDQTRGHGTHSLPAIWGGELQKFLAELTGSTHKVIPASSPSQPLRAEVERRRTFAIISHPDAGKTTLTEKLLLYAGAIELAGAVRGRKTERHVVSDWMDIERERGISVTSAAVEFELGPYRLTLLDTPGHRDFSEDTYRTLFAVDGVVMVIDGAKGIESQTRKLYEVCKLRRLPVLTFVNKMDQPSRDPFDLLDEIERVLGLHAVPMNWPIGSGDRFRGVFDLQSGGVHLYGSKGRAHPAPVEVGSPNDPRLAQMLGAEAWQHLIDETSLVTGAGTTFDHAAYLAGRHTPVFFGSALSSFGLEPFLKALTELAPPPTPRESDHGPIPPDAPTFSGFVFKIQANMNRRHRDRVAFVRVCSGVLEKDMVLTNARLESEIRAARPYRFFGGKRETIERAYPGDVVGLVNPGQFGIGDTLYADRPVNYPPIPRFPAEHFGIARLRDVRFKQFDEGIRQLEEEGLMQVLFPTAGRREPILGTVGPLQLEVAAARLQDEYNVQCDVEPLNNTQARWVEGDADKLAALSGSVGTLRAADRDGHPVILFESEWALDYCAKNNPDVKFLAVR